MVEDICVQPDGSFKTLIQGHVQPFFGLGEAVKCKYNQRLGGCTAASLIPQIIGGFNDTSNCRGQVHFFAVYYTAAALGFTQDVAYFLAAYSQAIDFVQYKGVDSCGADMEDRYWTPPMRGFLRTNTFAGGTVRHLGIPYVGTLQESGISQSSKQYTGGDSEPCTIEGFTQDYEFYESRCPGLDPNMTDMYYEGGLSSAQKWAFNQTDVLCTGGYTTIGADGSPFTGDACPSSGTVYSSVSAAVSGPIPLSGGDMELGRQLVDYDCVPACACAGTCNNTEDNSNFEKVNVVYDFGPYVENATSPYSRMSDGSKVSQAIARMGIFLHWVSDRASHFYCCDASESGISMYQMNNSAEYDLYMYMDTQQCNFVTHGLTHLWEQGATNALAPGSYSAMTLMYESLLKFRNQNLKNNSQWFDPEVEPLSLTEVVGNASNPGTMYAATMQQTAQGRVSYFVDALSENKLPPLPGFDTMCSNSKSPLRDLIGKKLRIGKE